MAQCQEVRMSSCDGITTVARCDDIPNHGPYHSARTAWFKETPEPENWQPGDVVKDARGRVFARTLSGYWWRLGIVESFDNDYPMRPLVKLVPELSAKPWNNA